MQESHSEHHDIGVSVSQCGALVMVPSHLGCLFHDAGIMAPLFHRSYLMKVCEGSTDCNRSTIIRHPIV